MNKVGYIISLVGGVLAMLFSVLLIISGPVLFAGNDVYDFVSDNSQQFGTMWRYIGEYNGAKALLENDFEDYVDEYTDILQDVDADKLEDIGKAYDVEAFNDLADIYQDGEEYLPKLRIGVIACLISSVIALVGAELARRYRVAGGAMVLSSAALTLIFSLVASSIVPMAVASLLLILGGVFQIINTKGKEVTAQSQEIAGQGGGIV